MIDGTSLLRELRILLDESSTSGFLDTKSSYGYCYNAAYEFVNRTNCLTSTQTITTIASQSGYSLNADFMKLYLKNKEGKYFIQYSDGTTTYNLTFKPYGEIIYENNTTAQSIPDKFTIIDDPDKDTQLSSTTTSAGAASGGQCTLTDTAADFSDVSPGDNVHNTTDGSNGIVLSKTSSTVLVTALFDGTNNDWTSGDAYIIQPQGRMKLQFDPPPSTASHTATVRYVQTPNPVFSSYGIYRIQRQYLMALVQYAAWLYKYKDSEENVGDMWYKYFDKKVREANNTLNHALNRTGWKFNPKKRS